MSNRSTASSTNVPAAPQPDPFPANPSEEVLCRVVQAMHQVNQVLDRIDAYIDRLEPPAAPPLAPAA